MANTYNPVSNLNFYGSINSLLNSTVIYYNSQQALGFANITNNTSFINIGNGTSTGFAPNLITIPQPGSYMVTINTAAFLTSGFTLNSRLFYKMLFTQGVQTPIGINDNLMTIVFPQSNVVLYNTFSRRVTFPTAGVWTLTPQWACDTNSGRSFSVNPDPHGLWIVTVHGPDPMNLISSQFTRFLDSSYTLMTNMDINAQWGGLAQSTVLGYGSSITSINSSVSSLSVDVGNLNTSVINLQNSVSGLTSLATTSGGIRIKP